MTGPDIFDDTTDDYERLETELVAQDRDAARVSTADVDERMVTPVPDQRILVHEPSGEAFDSITQLAVFHRGWQAATDADAVQNFLPPFRGVLPESRRVRQWKP
jgi:hypothetical protein